MIEAKTDELYWSKVASSSVGRTRSAAQEIAAYLAAKRVIDVILSAALLVLLLPLMALIALVIRLDSAGPAIFHQSRVGKWGRQFTMFKFRSMCEDADDELHRQFASEYINGNGKPSTEPNGAVFKLNADRRITRVGRWLRRTSLDELPQLLNVLKGDMSLVGPRPALAYEVQEYSGWHLKRLAVLPGMTGLSQISGRSGLTFEKIVRLDLLYIRRRSLTLDLAILLKTIPVVLAAKCAA